MPKSIEDIITIFESTDPAVRLEMLVDYADNLPPLPEHLKDDVKAGRHRVRACQAPVFVWILSEQGHLKLFGDVPREVPVVRGILALLIRVLDGATVSAGSNLPLDLISRMQLTSVIGLRRQQGIKGLLQHIRNACEALNAGEISKIS